LADLLTPLLAANPFSAVRALVRWWSNDEFEDGLTHRWQGWLRWRPVDSFFSRLAVFEPAMLEESEMNSGQEIPGDPESHDPPLYQRRRENQIPLRTRELSHFRRGLKGPGS
jgi:hypothetical protein